MSRNPLSAVPATRSSAPILKIRRFAVLGTLIAVALAGVFASIAWLTTDMKTVVQGDTTNFVAKSFAEIAVGDYLHARDSAVPAASNVDTNFSVKPGTAIPRKGLAVDYISYAGARPAPVGDGSKGTVGRLYTLQEVFLASLSGTTYRVVVPMVKQQGKWLLGAYPSLLVANLPSGDEPALDYSALYAKGGDSSLFPNPKGYLQRIGEWAKVYASAGKASAELYTLTGDTESRSYSGLGGWSVVGAPRVGSVVAVSSPIPGFITRVTVVLAPPRADGTTLTAEYDLYIRSDKSQKQPPVVAWSAAGSYQPLTPYMNADR